jgi:uncharacterized protein (DUF433 family)
MKLKTETFETLWRGPAHTHHVKPTSRHRILAWPLPFRERPKEHDESLNGDSCYPASIVKVFEDAIRRCPSISIDREIMEGQPCIEGTRIPVRSVLRALELCGSVEGIRKCYPQLSPRQVDDALYFSQVVLELPSGIDETAVTH